MKIIDQRKVGLYTLILRDDGIMYSHVSDERPETVESLKEAVQVMGEMLNYKKAPMLNTRDEFAFPSNEIRSFWAQKDAFPYSVAEAYILPTLALKMIGNAYNIVNKPVRPTQFFVNEKDAIFWLKSFLLTESLVTKIRTTESCK